MVGPTGGTARVRLHRQQVPGLLHRGVRARAHRDRTRLHQRGDDAALTMDIAFTDEQQLLQDTAARLGESVGVTGPEQLPTDEVLDAQWDQIVELGVPTLRSPALCGLAASGVETAIVIEQLARTLSAVPVMGQAVLAAELLEAARAEKELQLVADGSLRLAPVLSMELTGFAAANQPAVGFDAA